MVGYLWIPTQAGGVVFHVVLPQFFQQSDKRANPFNVFLIPKRRVCERERRHVALLDALVFEIFDQPITIELRFFLDILYERPWFSLLEEG